MNQEIIAKEAVEAYKIILFDVAQGKNLDMHLKTVDADIAMLKGRVIQAKANNEAYHGFEKLLNELFHIKFDILEQL